MSLPVNAIRMQASRPERIKKPMLKGMSLMVIQ
jgi:hypothetical protein